MWDGTLDADGVSIGMGFPRRTSLKCTAARFLRVFRGTFMNTFNSLAMTLNLGPQMFFICSCLSSCTALENHSAFFHLPAVRFFLPLVLFLVCLRLSYNLKTAT